MSLFNQYENNLFAVGSGRVVSVKIPYPGKTGGVVYELILLNELIKRNKMCIISQTKASGGRPFEAKNTLRPPGWDLNEQKTMPQGGNLSRQMPARSTQPVLLRRKP